MPYWQNLVNLLTYSNDFMHAKSRMINLLSYLPVKMLRHVYRSTGFISTHV